MNGANHDTLLGRARRLDEPALDEIYRIFSPAIYRYALRLSGSQVMAEECVAETFSRLLIALSKGGGPKDHLSAYLYRMAHNWITDTYRSRPEEPGLDPEIHSDPELEPGLQVDRKLQTDLVRMALLRLTPEQRQVLSLRYLEDLDHEEIALTMQKPVGAVKALQHRGLAALRRILRPETEMQ